MTADNTRTGPTRLAGTVAPSLCLAVTWGRTANVIYWQMRLWTRQWNCHHFFCTGNTVTQQVQCMVYIIYNTLRYNNSTVVQNTSKIKAYESKVEFSFNSGSKRVG